MSEGYPAIPPTVVVPGNHAGSGNASRSGSIDISSVSKKLTADDWLKELEHSKQNGQPFREDLLCVAEFMSCLDEFYPVSRHPLGHFLKTVGTAADVIAPNSEGLTPLQIAAEQSDVISTRLLFGWVDNLDGTSRKGQTPVEYFRSRTYTREFPHDRISLTSFKDGCYNKEITFPLKEYSKRETELRDTVKLGNAEQGVPIIWIHVHSTNGIILEEINWTLRGSINVFDRWNESESVLSENQVLSHREPGFSQNELGTVIVFPCLRLRTIQEFNDNRKKLKKALGLVPFEPKRRLDGCNYLYGERTLDEAYYPGLPKSSLEKRNQDQVVTRHFDTESDWLKKPILMVSQVWIWQNNKTILSAFPIKDEYDEGMPYDWSRTAKGSPEGFVGNLIAFHVREFDAAVTDSSCGNGFRPALSIFESALISTLADVDIYLEADSQQNFDEKKERGFIHEISDIRSELVMILDVLVQQKEVMHDLLKLSTEQKRAQWRQQLQPRDERDDLENWKNIEKAATLIARYIKRAMKIDKDAERIEQVIQNKLNLRRTAASISDAHNSLEQAKSSRELADASLQEARYARILSLSVFGFTIITFIFTPLSFIASLLALDVDFFRSMKHRADVPAIDGSGSELYDGKKVIGVFIGTEMIATSLTALLGYGTWRFFDFVFTGGHFAFKPTCLSDVLNRLGTSLQITPTQQEPELTQTKDAVLDNMTRTAPENKTASTSEISRITESKDKDMPEKRGNTSSRFSNLFSGMFKRNGMNKGTLPR